MDCSWRQKSRRIQDVDHNCHIPETETKSEASDLQKEKKDQTVIQNSSFQMTVHFVSPFKVSVSDDDDLENFVLRKSCPLYFIKSKAIAVIF